jgi:hypothetical protein
MAKGNPNSAAVQFKVHLKPTEIGMHVMKRMERPHLDKSAELRRFIELGYAAEQAGFILDGSVLRHAGRTWDIQPDLGMQSQSQCPTFHTEQLQTNGSDDQFGESAPVTAAAPDEARKKPAASDSKASTTPSSALRSNLRGISG